MSTTITEAAMTTLFPIGKAESMGIEDEILEAVAKIADTKYDTRAQCAEKCGITSADLSRWLNKKRRPLESIGVLLDALGFKVLSPEEQHCPPTVCDMGDYALVPKVRAKAGAGSSLITDGEEVGLYAFRKEFLKRIGLDGNNDLVLFDVMGESMEPTIMHKDTVLASKRESDPVSGQIYVIRVDDELLVKRILREPGKLIVVSDNPAHRSFEIDLAAPHPNFEIIGRVRWQGRVY